MVQGMLGEAYFLVTCPIDFFSRVQVQVFQDGPRDGPNKVLNDEAKIAVPDGCSKSAAALRATLLYLGKDNFSAELRIKNRKTQAKRLASTRSCSITIR